MSNALTLMHSGQTWTDRIAKLMIEMLFERAIAHEPITYGDMGRLLEKKFNEHPVHAAAYGNPAGKIGDVLILLSAEKNTSIPPINAILVNQATKVAGSGADYYLKKFRNVGQLTRQQRHSLAKETIEDVFAYADWRSIAKQLNIKLPAVVTPSLKPIKPPVGSRHGGGPERQDHIDLKKWVAKNPTRFARWGKFKEGDPEYPLQSGDRLDVFFSNKTTWLGVEVKAGSNEGEMWRGVFQCVKYRALLVAECKQQAKIPNAHSILVLDSPPTAKIRELAKVLDVKWINVRRFQ